jgi:GNAT superfamily N-acetyltransferase
MSSIIEAAERMSEEPKAEAPKPPYVIREARASDLAFVRNGWIESLMMRVRSRLTAEVKQLLREGKVRVACDPDDPDTLLGFAVIDGKDPACLHYAYVRNELRREGIGTALVHPDDVRVFTFKTDDLVRAFKSEERGWTHQPKVVL